MKLTINDIYASRTYNDFCVIITDKKEFGESLKPKTANKFVHKLLLIYGTDNRKLIYKAIKHAVRTV